MHDPPAAVEHSERRRGVLIAAEFVFFSALAVASTWPLVRYFTTALPLGTEPVATVPLLNNWTLGWNADRLARGYRDYWDAPIFYPTRQTFAFSEPQPLTGLVAAPLVWLSPTSMLAYNVVVLVALTLNGWSATRFLRALGIEELPALAGGAMMLTLTYVFARLGVLQLIPVFGIIWTFQALWRLGECPTLARGGMLGLAFGATLLMCGHYALFLAVILPLSGGWLIRRPWTIRRLWAALVFAAVVAVLITWPVVQTQRSVFREHKLTREPEKVTLLSAIPADFGVTPWRQLVPLPISQPTAWKLSPGTLKWPAAVLGAIIALWLGRHRRFVAFALTVSGFASILAMGLRLSIGGIVPFQWLIDYVPGFAQVRSAYRFAVLLEIMLVLLSAFALQFVIDLFRKSSRPIWRLLLAGGLGTLLTVEAWPPSQPLFVLPTWEDNREWVEWLRDHTPANAVIAHVPFPKGTEPEAYLPTAHGMRWTLIHGRPLVNGYSGFAPRPYLDLAGAMQAFPNAACFAKLKAMQVTHLVVQSAEFSREFLERHPLAAAWIEWEMTDPRAGLDIYRLVGEPLPEMFIGVAAGREVSTRGASP